MARITDAISVHLAKPLSGVDAAELFGMRKRRFRRLRDAFAAHGAEAIIDRRRGRASGRRAAVDEIAWIANAFHTRYFDFAAKHLHAAVLGPKMADGRPFTRSSTWTKSVLQSPGLTSKARIRGARIGASVSAVPWPCMPAFQPFGGSPRDPRAFDALRSGASTHAWLPKGPELDLSVTMDAATSRISSIFLALREGTASRFRGLS